MTTNETAYTLTLTCEQFALLITVAQVQSQGRDVPYLETEREAWQDLWAYLLGVQEMLRESQQASGGEG